MRVAATGRRILPRIVLLAVFFTLPLLVHAADFPRPVGYVNDFANVVDPAKGQQIATICRELEEKTGAQIALATFKNMDGDEIDGFTVKLLRGVETRPEG